ncbi:MAG: hypothetical protein WDN31_17775 [Hyphomicrobium sp.]
MIAKFAIIIGQVASEFRDLNRASNHGHRVSLVMPKFARCVAAGCGELRDLNRASKPMLRVPGMMPKLALGCGGELWRTSASGH